MKFDATRRPVTTSNGEQRSALRSFTIMLCGSLLLGTAQIAEAAHDRPTFREFRESHDDLGRRESRQLFRATYNGRSTGGASIPPPIIPKSPTGVTDAANFHHIIWNGGNQNTTGRQAKEIRVGTQTIGTNVVRLNRGVDLDLSSADQNIVLGANLFQNATSVEITVGNEKQTFSAGSKATAAEYIAIKQALSSSGGQKLVINQSGIASGGSVDLTQITDNNDPLRASSLTVASGVTTYGDFSKRSDFRLTGDLNNYGTVVALSSDRAVRSGAIRADDITNNVGATITSVVPDSLASSHLARAVDLTLDARGDLTNFGTLASSGDLSLIAGNSVNNSGSVTAHNSVNLSAPNINNSGTVIASAGNINLNGPSTAALTVNNTGGTLSALRGAINVRTPDYAGTFNNNISGGDLLSTEVNINGGNATNYMDVNELTGTVSQTGSAGHITVSTETLKLGSNCLTGDPTFFNTAGDILITGNLSASENLTIIAKGSIQTNGVTIEARNATQGFDITMIAGAKIVTPAAGGDGTLPPGTASAVTIDGTASASGGSIALAPGTTIITSPTTGGTGAGGNVSLFAFQSAGPALGRVDVNSGSIITGGVGTAANGNVLIVAGGSNSGGGTAIQIGAINTIGGTGGGGDLTIVNAQPVASAGNITYNSDGTLVPGSFLQAAVALNPNASIGQAGGQAKISGNAFFNAGKDIIQDNSAVNSSLYTDNFNSVVTLKAGNDIGAGNPFPFIIEGFNGRITNKILKAHGGTAGNNLLTVTAGGDATIVRNATTDLSLEASTSVGAFLVKTNSKLTVAGNVSATGTATGTGVTLQNTGGALIVNPGVQITGYDSIELTNGTKKKPTLLLGTNSGLTTTATVAVPNSGIGDIFITIDPKAFALNGVGFASTKGHKSPTTNGFVFEPLEPDDDPDSDVDGTTPNLVQHAGRRIDFAPPANTLTSNNAPVLIQNSGKNGAIQFGGGVTVKAGQ